MEVDYKRFIVQLDDEQISAFLLRWLDHGKPCPLLFQRPNTDGQTAVRLQYPEWDTESILFLREAVEWTGCRLYER